MGGDGLSIEDTVTSQTSRDTRGDGAMRGGGGTARRG